MAPYAFHPGWAEQRRHVHERLSYPTRGHLNNSVNRPMQDNHGRVGKKVWRAKSPSAEISEPSKQREKNTSAETILIGTKELTIKEPIIVDNLADSNKDVAAVQQGPMANDHEASTSKAKSRDPKYTHPKWCPSGLTRAQKGDCST